MPASFVTTDRTAPVLVFFSVTVTPGSTPPVESLVTPVIVPVVSCAEAVVNNPATSSIISPSLRMPDLLWFGSLSLLRQPPTRTPPAPRQLRQRWQSNGARGYGVDELSRTVQG